MDVSRFDHYPIAHCPGSPKFLVTRLGVHFSGGMGESRDAQLDRPGLSVEPRECAFYSDGPQVSFLALHGETVCPQWEIRGFSRVRVELTRLSTTSNSLGECSDGQSVANEGNQFCACIEKSSSSSLLLKIMI